MLVQLVMAAITTSPSLSDELERVLGTGTNFLKASGACPSGTRFCGRLGPDTLGSTADRSISITAVNSAGGVSGSRHNPCALQ